MIFLVDVHFLNDWCVEHVFLKITYKYRKYSSHDWYHTTNSWECIEYWVGCPCNGCLLFIQYEYQVYRCIEDRRWASRNKVLVISVPVISNVLFTKRSVKCVVLENGIVLAYLKVVSLTDVPMSLIVQHIYCIFNRTTCQLILVKILSHHWNPNLKVIKCLINFFLRSTLLTRMCFIQFFLITFW